LANRLFLKQRQKIIFNLAEFDRKHVALDAGCGSGEFIQNIAPHYKKVIGIDYSSMMLDQAKSRVSNVTFLKADCKNLPVENESIDCLFALGLFDYVENVNKVLNEFCRVLKKGGYIIFTIPKSPSLFTPIRWSHKFRRKIFKIPPIINSYTKKQLVSCVKDAEFNIINLYSLWTTMWIIKVKK
jgi:ubiquinone/menaquinone biosynthesis C-methylase UbiE